MSKPAPSNPRTFLFGNFTIATASSGRSRFGHTFGGPHDRKGTSRKKCGGILIHLLHRLDLTDPAIPFTIPGVRWLPIYYCFDFRATALGYRLISDDRLETFFPAYDPHVTEHESWPGEDYPLVFPRSDIAIGAFPYDPTNLDDAFAWCGIFGIEKLSKRNQTHVRKRIAKDADLFGFAIPETDEQFREALSHPFMQGKPNSTCLNPKCPNHEVRGQLSTIALVPAEPVNGVHTFGTLGSGVRLIVELCNRCWTLHVCNECT